MHTCRLTPQGWFPIHKGSLTHTHTHTCTSHTCTTRTQGQPHTYIYTHMYITHTYTRTQGQPHAYTYTHTQGSLSLHTDHRHTDAYMYIHVCVQNILIRTTTVHIPRTPQSPLLNPPCNGGGRWGDMDSSAVHYVTDVQRHRWIGTSCL